MRSLPSLLFKTDGAKLRRQFQFILDNLSGGARMIKRTLGCLALCGWLMALGSLQAHHSLAGVYNMTKEIEKTGALESVKFVNPHGSLTIGVANPDGTTTSWVMTLGSATGLAAK